MWLRLLNASRLLTGLPLVLLCVQGNPLLAQSTTPPAEQVPTGSIQVSGTVIPHLSNQQIILEVVYGVQFGSENPDDLFLVVDPISTPASADQGAGYIIAKGEPGVQFGLFFSRTIELESLSGGESLIVNYLMSHNRDPEQSASVYVLEQFPVFRLNEKGEYHFWLGGNVSIVNAASDGLYVGDFSMEVEYL